MAERIRVTAPPDLVLLAAVEEVLVRYATGIDTRDWSLLRSCFADDIDADYGEVPGRGVLRWQDADVLTAWMEQAHASFDHTLHRITNVRVEPSGRGDRVRARSCVDVLFTTSSGELLRHGAGVYDDELVCMEDGWRIVRRRYTHMLTEGPSPAT
jgi:3-phenylpropionate/cinnamic acid dioxygenase small subunit